MLKITRRSFILTLSCLPFVQIKENTTGFKYNMHPAQRRFMESSEVPTALWGVPYHQSNGSTGSWLGIKRA